MTSDDALHPALIPISFLIGRWRGEGRGDYPTIEAFSYEEEVTFGTIPGKPFLTYQQRTRGADGRPLHTEAGYVRPVGTDGAELILAQPTGVTEIHRGIVTGRSIAFETLGVGLSPTAKEVRSVTRRISVDDEALSYVLHMAAVGRDLQFHLEATLHRV